ncbi:hypothetical protein DPMN_115130 [Dreissena polymorpha]|uniref:Uncharacterized protein n=1 Tax=Dreissena polymorpha TaxID=45954 RepID=A0A9D4KKM9_DREPO|nr:hypothetical protein DPMN_115130 [Dreissena polymorpha]
MKTEIIGALPNEKFVEENVEKRQITGQQISSEVEINCQEARKKQQRDFEKTNLKKRLYTTILIGDKVLKFNASRAGCKAKGDLGTNYTGPFIADDIKGGVAKLKKFNGVILKTSVALNNVKHFLDESVDGNINVATSQVKTTPSVNTPEKTLETIELLTMPSDPKPLAEGERMTVCGERVEETNLDESVDENITIATSQVKTTPAVNTP